MKKLFLTFTTGMTALFITAQSPSTNATQNVTETDSTVTVAIDSPIVKQSVEPKSCLQIIGEEEVLLHDGKIYKLEELIEADSQLETLQDNNRDLLQDKYSNHDFRKLIALAICFIVPCVTLLIALTIFMIFFIKKNRERNRIIEKAIDANYQLPDSFFTAQRRPAGDPFVMPNESFDPAMSQERTQQNSSGWLKLSLTDPSTRDPKKSSSGVTLVAIGAALLLFFLIYTDFSVAVLAGGISLFLGIGRLIGYFYVPGYTSNNNRSSQMYPPRPPYNQQHMNFNEGFRQQSSQCPPPINDNMQNNKNN